MKQIELEEIALNGETRFTDSTYSTFLPTNSDAAPALSDLGHNLSVLSKQSLNMESVSEVEEKRNSSSSKSLDSDEPSVE